MVYKIKGYGYDGSFMEWRAKELAGEYRKKGYKVDILKTRKNYKRYYQVVFYKPAEIRKLATKRKARRLAR